MNPASSVYKLLFLQNPGEPIVRWSTWFDMFEDFLVASNFPADQNDRRAALLRSSLGIEGYLILRSLKKGEKTSNDDTVATLRHTLIDTPRRYSRGRSSHGVINIQGSLLQSLLLV